MDVQTNILTILSQNQTNLCLYFVSSFLLIYRIRLKKSLCVTDISNTISINFINRLYHNSVSENRYQQIISIDCIIIPYQKTGINKLYQTIEA